jgi:hypothetical protein
MRRLSTRPTVRERRVGKHIVHRLIDLEAHVGLVLSDSIRRADRAGRRTPCRAILSNKTVEELDGRQAEDQ